MNNILSSCKEMIQKKWMLNGLYLLITLIAFSVSILKFDNSVWIVAWIAPVFMIRFMRNNKWIPALILAFMTLLMADFISKIPLFGMIQTTSIKMDFMFILKWQIESGALFVIPSLLIPFILDKALNKRLPKIAASLVYPAAVVTIELLIPGARTFGNSQFALPSLVITASLFGISCLSFLIAWFASMLNWLWEKKWEIKKVGKFGLVYLSIMGLILIHGGITAAFPKKADNTVAVAGITLDYNIFDSMSVLDLNITDILNLNPPEYAELMSSPQMNLDEMRRKTLEAAKAGAKIIIWQETALALESSVADSFLKEMNELADKEDIYLLVSYERLLNEKEKKDKLMKNIGILFTPEGDVGWEYVKAFPVAGLEEKFFEAGPGDIPYLDTPYGRIGQVICADTGPHQYIRQAAAKNIDLLLVPSLDTISYTPLYSFTSAISAVENGFTMVRITGDGHSAVIDPYYRHWAGQNSFEQGTGNFYVNVPVISIDTFYSSIGFIFPYSIVLVLLLLIVLAFIRRKEK